MKDFRQWFIQSSESEYGCGCECETPWPITLGFQYLYDFDKIQNHISTRSPSDWQSIQKHLRPPLLQSYIYNHFYTIID